MQKNHHDISTLGGLLEESRRSLKAAGVNDPGLEARLIVGHFTDTTVTEAITAPERAVDAAAAAAVRAAVERRSTGTPVHRILGRREFYGLTLGLSPATLEPRPDTETLVDLVLPEARRIAAQEGRCRILDLGTGTGAVALAFLSMVPKAEAVGTDISHEALETARSNAEINGYSERFATLRSDWLDAVEGCFDLIVSNPPYIPTRDMASLERTVLEHDPRAALDGGSDGLDAYRAIAAGARRHLAEEGVIAVETGYDQKAAVASIFRGEGFRTLKTARDLGGRDRAMLFAPAGEDDPKEKRLGKVWECR